MPDTHSIFNFSFVGQAADYGTIKEKITTADNKPAEGVTILLKNTLKAAGADNEGVFEIKNVSPDTYSLVVSLVGYQDYEKEIVVEADQTTTVDVQLSLSNRELNAVVVVANLRTNSA